MHAFLIVGKSDEALEKELAIRLKEWNAAPWDIVRPTSTGISDIRQFRRELAISPLGTCKVGVIPNIDAFTPEAQNALLKTLEEPPTNTYIIGTTQRVEMILPTIRSRMQQIILTDAAAPAGEYQKILRSLLSGSVSDRLQILEGYGATRDDAKLFVSGLTLAVHRELLIHPTPALTRLARNLLTASAQLSVNVTPRLVIDIAAAIM